MKKYTITLADSRQINDLELNGNCFVSVAKVDENVFEDNLGTFIVTCNGKEVWQSKNVFLVNQQEFDDKWLLCFAEKSAVEVEKERLEAKITALELALTEAYELIDVKTTEMQLALTEVYEQTLGV